MLQPGARKGPSGRHQGQVLRVSRLLRKEELRITPENDIGLLLRCRVGLGWTPDNLQRPLQVELIENHPPCSIEHTGEGTDYVRLAVAGFRPEVPW